MSKRLQNKVAVITGAGSGMGRAMAELFAEEGAKVVCADISGKQEEVAKGIGANAVAIRADVASEDDIRAMIDAATDHFGRLDILVNNAGFGGPMKLLHEQDAETWDKVHDVNVRGVFLGMKYGVESMLRTGGGAIVNIASSTGLIGWRRHGVYAAAKGGVVQMTKCAALDYAEMGIRVNAICPGTFWTGLVPASADNPEPPADAFKLPGIPMNRWGLPREIATAALFLASDDASYVTGTALPVDGGYAVGFSGMAAEQD